MKKNDIVDYIVSNTSLRRSQAIKATDAIFESISKSLVRGESVNIRGFATIKVVTSAPKKARNISQGTEVMIPARKRVKIILGKDITERLNG